MDITMFYIQNSQHYFEHRVWRHLYVGPQYSLCFNLSRGKSFKYSADAQVYQHMVCDMFNRVYTCSSGNWTLFYI